MLRKALKNVIYAQGGIEQLSLQVRQYYHKDQMLLEKGEVEFYCINALLDALGFCIAVTVKSASGDCRLCLLNAIASHYI